MMTVDGRELTVDFWIRDCVPTPIRETQQRAYNRLRELRVEGSIADVQVCRWSAYHRLDDTRSLPGSDPVTTAVKAFERWARREGYDLEPAFRPYAPSGDTDPEYDVLGEIDESERMITLPIMAMAVYEQETLQEVAPRSDGGRVYTVPDAIAALETESRFLNTRRSAPL